MHSTRRSGDTRHASDRCRKCRTALQDSANFCDQCGARRRQREVHKRERSSETWLHVHRDAQADCSDAAPSSTEHMTLGSAWFWGNRRSSLSRNVTEEACDGDDDRAQRVKTPSDISSTAADDSNFVSNFPLSHGALSSNQRSLLLQRGDHRGNSREDDCSAAAGLTTEVSGKRGISLPPIADAFAARLSKQQAHHVCDANTPKHPNSTAMASTRHARSASNGELWGACLDNAIAVFQATEIILAAELDSDERCMSFLRQQQLRLQEQQQRSAKGLDKTLSRSPQSAQLELKLVALERKLHLNSQKLRSVRVRLEELRASASSTLRCNNGTRSNNDDGAEESSLVGELGGIRSELDLEQALPRTIDGAMAGESELSLKRSKKMRKRRRPTCDESRRLSSPVDDLRGSDDRPRQQDHARRDNDSRSTQETAAAIRIQSMFRRRAGRAALRRLLADVYEKAFDPDSNAWYYYSKRTQQSQWDAPALVSKLGLDLSLAATSTSTGNGTDGSASRREHDAAQRIQRIYRARATQQFLRDLAAGVLERVRDADAGAWYFFNHRTQQSFWETPAHVAAHT